MTGRSMRAAALDAPGSVRVGAVRRPDPGPREIRVRLEGCGVCGSSLPVWEGRPWFEYPLEWGRPGHEGWGRVDAIGRDVDGLSEGDRVAVLSQRAFAAYDLAPADAVVPLPPSLPDRPFPGEALGCAMNVFRRAGIRAEHSVAVVGSGFLGALLVALSAAAGALVIALSRRETSLAAARRMGASHTVRLGGGARRAGADTGADADGPQGGDVARHPDTDTVGGARARVAELTGDRMCDRVIEAAGAQAALDVASALVRVRGRLIIAGYHQDGPRSVDLQSWNWRGLDVVNAHERDPRAYVRGMREAAEAVARGALDPFPLITHDLPLERLGDAFTLLRERPAGFMKAVVRP